MNVEWSVKYLAKSEQVIIFVCEILQSGLAT